MFKIIIPILLKGKFSYNYNSSMQQINYHNSNTLLS